MDANEDEYEVRLSTIRTHFPHAVTYTGSFIWSHVNKRTTHWVL